MTKPMLRTVVASSLIGALAGCGSDPSAGETTSTGTQTGTNTGTRGSVYEIPVAPIRELDLVFMIDNSVGMPAKVDKMNAQWSKMLAALKDPTDGTYPDLRVALIDSDLGTGGAYARDSCGPNASNGQSAYGDLGNFQMRGGTGCGMNSADALWIEYTKGLPVNYTAKAGQDINNVFQCLATNLGESGCGEEHSLQAFEFALVAQNLHVDQFSLQNSFLRPEAYLGLVFITDEDDCSAATNDGMFGDKVELRGESASLRCATRGHRCNGANLSDTTPPGYPTTAAFTADFQNCAARTDACPNTTDGNGVEPTDTSGPTSCSPLKSVHNMAAEIKALKGDQAQILVAGIFGWPRKGADGKPDLANAQYRIDFVPNPNSADIAHPFIYDYWPVCYDPNHLPKSSGFDSDAWGWGAPGGLRLSAFVDEFGSNGLKYSICEPDFTDAMTGIGAALATKMQNLCIPSSFDQGKTCKANYSTPVVDVNGKIGYVANPVSLAQCSADTLGAADCYALVTDPVLCPGDQYRVQLTRTAQEIATGPLTPGTKVVISCQ